MEISEDFFLIFNAHYQLRTEVPPKIQRSIWELILMHLPSTKMLAQYLVEVLSTALNSLVAGLTSLKIWSTKSAKKRHLCASISAHSLHWQKFNLLRKIPVTLSGIAKLHNFNLQVKERSLVSQPGLNPYLQARNRKKNVDFWFIWKL